VAVQIQGNSGVIAEVENNTRAIRMTPRPVDVGTLGSYGISAATGIMAATLAAGSPIFSFRWGDATRFALIRVVKIDLVSLGTGFTAGNGLMEMVFARAFTGSDTGGTLIDLTGNNVKRRTTFGSSLVTSMRISSTATLSAGTRTLDANALATLRFGVSATANVTQLALTPIWSPDFTGEWPLVLSKDEGFIIRATVPATGTWTGDVNVEWTEIGSF